ncbi:pirin family protein [Alkalicella caledoniensis]|uniref:Pirin family protein n=1 Tax=Alkalicella caledoniensis TaxID=2731377 RepID=A0A7G9W3M4_ALKCA|nr:pirin family protein [Alkalicella caledoniensis]QNO13286.1 pirin family protein [Alkalicella caledoniensis]
MANKIISISDLKFMEEPGDPFIVRMHHVDYYPKSNGNLGVTEEQLKSRSLGNDFDFNNEWKMYYGKEVPGFPSHPHRGFETVTVVLQGYVDHSDSSGAVGRYGAGDVQWMTAGRGMQHAEMFPLINQDKENTMELFQIWLNLPSKDKLVEPSYKMLWAEDIPTVEEIDEAGNKATINVIAGSHNGTKSLKPTINSWANNRDNNVGIWSIKLQPAARFTIPSISSTLNRNLYFYRGGSIKIEGTKVDAPSSIKLVGDEDIIVINGNEESYLVLLEGEPIKEPVVAKGPFVMNTEEEITQAYEDYRKTGFGGWPYDRRDPVNHKDKGRFAKYNEDYIEIR